MTLGGLVIAATPREVFDHVVRARLQERLRHPDLLIGLVDFRIARLARPVFDVTGRGTACGGQSKRGQSICFSFVLRHLISASRALGITAQLAESEQCQEEGHDQDSRAQVHPDASRGMPYFEDPVFDAHGSHNSA